MKVSTLIHAKSHVKTVCLSGQNNFLHLAHEQLASAANSHAHVHTETQMLQIQRNLSRYHTPLTHYYFRGQVRHMESTSS